MLRALYSAASGMMAQQYNMDTISNNLSNVNTVGFKKSRAEFQDLLYTQVQPPVPGATVGIQVGQGARLGAINRIYSGGQLQLTGNTFDLAIQGNGFFQVQQADGSTGYTRDGAFHLDAQRQLVTANGDPVLGAKGIISIPAGADDVSIGMDGTIRYTDAAGKTTTVDQIQLAVFTNPSGMEALGNNLLAANDVSGEALVTAPGTQDAGTLAQGSLEGSNVQVVEEMVNLITAQRAYEINSKVVQSSDEMMGMANNLRRG